MFYKVVLNGACQGQDIKNILYYRSGAGFDGTLFLMAGAEALAGNIVQEIVPSFLAALPNDYTLETVDVYPINEAFELLYQMPYSLAVAQSGGRAATHTGPASCVIIKFMLEPTNITNGINPPKRGYVAIGPVTSDFVAETGFLTAGATQAGQELPVLAAKLAQNIEQLLPVPASWFPVRMKQNRILGGLVKWESYADVKGGIVSRRVSFRRSRMPEQ
jgi:hypothetical protein